MIEEILIGKYRYVPDPNCWRIGEQHYFVDVYQLMSDGTQTHLSEPFDEDISGFSINRVVWRDNTKYYVLGSEPNAYYVKAKDVKSTTYIVR
ncbi:hypothetical protein [Lactobacillus hominis]|uniref:Uncharacterized protein n=1 Tax=Lactobacillus hominis DSM 23910 = CRBIP 24.179 TaxID=1423758 RepID=I7LAW0_9LACO|nr:hypothetical protein [Lactobacillus hominis]KRM84174.1 hypothetical protein FC41_GL001476 [Lactobacillus hominis DSM 23910 = CRBIP 24.179]MCT3348378.1 hypothetical protein [Lactobacillus hominis]CCI82614.1 Protein of unknown function [Lactobacillus hominis DSM 23910 = CRBIP 24.179]